VSTEPLSSFSAAPTGAPIVLASHDAPLCEPISRNSVVATVCKANAPQRAIAAAPSWNHIEPAIGKPGWVVSLGILAVLSTLLVGLWMERRSADKRVDSPADVPELRSYLTGELGQ
jgi:hypothetical protein